MKGYVLRNHLYLCYSRHPGQLYESISCVLLFALLLWLWFNTKYFNGRPPVRHLPDCLLRHANRVGIFQGESGWIWNALPLNMGQLLSIPLGAGGVYFLARSYRKLPAWITDVNFSVRHRVTIFFIACSVAFTVSSAFAFSDVPADTIRRSKRKVIVDTTRYVQINEIIIAGNKHTRNTIIQRTCTETGRLYSAGILASAWKDKRKVVQPAPVSYGSNLFARCRRW